MCPVRYCIRIVSTLLQQGKDFQPEGVAWCAGHHRVRDVSRVKLSGLKDQVKAGKRLVSGPEALNIKVQVQATISMQQKWPQSITCGQSSLSA